jgi:hypothetical protein
MLPVMMKIQKNNVLISKAMLSAKVYTRLEAMMLKKQTLIFPYLRQIFSHTLSVETRVLRAKKSNIRFLYWDIRPFQ